MENKNPTSQDESGVLFQINHVDPPLRVKGAGAGLLTWQLNRPSDINHPVILANAEIQLSQGLFWIPALRSAAAGMTRLVAGVIIGVNIQRKFGDVNDKTGLGFGVQRLNDWIRLIFF